MNFFKVFFFVFTLLIVSNSLLAQKYAQKISSATWYCTCDLKSDSIILHPTNSSNFRFRVNFSPEGNLQIYDLVKKSSNSTYKYAFGKSTLQLVYETKDSLADLNYVIKKNKTNHTYELGLYYDLRYKKRKPTDTPPVSSFSLVKGKKTQRFDKLEEITVFRTKKGLHHDSIEIISKGSFLEIRSDTLVLNAYQFSEHNFYKRYPDTNHYFSETLFDTLIKIKSPIKEITKIHSQRDALNRVVNTAAITALGVFFVSFPLALTVNSSSAGSTLGQVAAFSALSIPVIVSFNMMFSKKKFQIAPENTKKATWKIVYKKELSK